MSLPLVRDVRDVTVTRAIVESLGVQVRLGAMVELPEAAAAAHEIAAKCDFLSVGVQHQPPRVAAAQVDLLQVGVEPALGEQVALRLQLLGEERHLRQRRGVGQARHVQPRDAGKPSIERRDLAALGQQVVASQTLVGADQTSHFLGHLGDGRLFAGHHVGVEVGRPPHRLAGVVDDEIQARPGRDQLAQNASTLGVCRRSRPKISRRSAHSWKSGSRA